MNANPAAARTVILSAEETKNPGLDAEYHAFDELAGKLVKVPKAEIDAQRDGGGPAASS